ncbi:Crp/Fnr family transcriptional regulator [Taibaiella koreensis]|uniref:Crp/Fnr family transcriptional regulator n=1 Tax=Taibaiella koreensis TaxID=1268548 RepID=UPI000E59C3C1|nr:Crp/Fnr family transcriptional regulator [Taibaiella koreensis]
MDTDLILEHVARHIRLEEKETEFFLSLLHPATIPRKSFLLQPGNISRNESFITSGCLRTYTVDDKGQDHILMFGIEGWWMSDLYSFLTQTPSSCFIDALEDTSLLQLSKSNLEKLYEAVPRFERYFRLILQNAFVAQQQRINQNLSFTAEERYREFTRKYPGLEQRIAQKHIAAYLGITPVFLSMLRRKLSGK